MSKRFATIIVFIVLASALGSCKQPRPTDRSGWEPSFAEDPPGFDVDLDVQPLEDDPAQTVSLKWKLGKETFTYRMNNRVTINTEGTTAGDVDTSTAGSIEIDPLSGGGAHLTMTSRLGSGQGVPFTRTYRVDKLGRIRKEDARAQAILDLIFPLDPEPLTPGEKQVREVTIPDDAGQAQTRARSTFGITGFARVLGRTCAVVALEHEARIFAREEGRMTDTGSVKRVDLLGYFDLEAGRYVAVSIREHSVTYRSAGKSITDRWATYVLEEEG